MSVESHRKTAPQPDLPYYPPTALRIYDDYTRESYFAKFGERAPAWDKEKRIKRWFDTDALAASTSPDTDTVTYKIFRFGSNTIETMIMTVREAAAINLPGVDTWPKYTIAPTDARMVDGTGHVISEVRPEFYTIRQQADALLAELQALTDKAKAVQLSLDFTSGPFQIRYGSDPRRPWEITYEGASYPLNVGSMILQKNAHGVGAPGHWDVTTGQQPIWVTEVPANSSTYDNRPEVDVPIRALLPNEKISVTMMGMDVNITRTDKTSPYNPAPQAGQGGAVLDPAVVQAIVRMDNNVKWLAANELGVATSLKPQF